MRNLNALPIACTLTPGDLRERLGAIQTLTREALLGYERNALKLALRFMGFLSARPRKPTAWGAA